MALFSISMIIPAHADIVQQILNNNDRWDRTITIGDSYEYRICYTELNFRGEPHNIPWLESSKPMATGTHSNNHSGCFDITFMAASKDGGSWNFEGTTTDRLGHYITYEDGISRVSGNVSGEIKQDTQTINYVTQFIPEFTNNVEFQIRDNYTIVKSTDFYQDFHANIFSKTVMFLGNEVRIGDGSLLQYKPLLREGEIWSKTKDKIKNNSSKSRTMICGDQLCSQIQGGHFQWEKRQMSNLGINDESRNIGTLTRACENHKNIEPFDHCFSRSVDESQKLNLFSKEHQIIVTGLIHRYGFQDTIYDGDIYTIDYTSPNNRKLADFLISDDFPFPISGTVINHSDGNNNDVSNVMMTKPDDTINGKFWFRLMDYPNSQPAEPEPVNSSPQLSISTDSGQYARGNTITFTITNIVPEPNSTLTLFDSDGKTIVYMPFTPINDPHVINMPLLVGNPGTIKALIINDKKFAETEFELHPEAPAENEFEPEPEITTENEFELETEPELIPERITTTSEFVESQSCMGESGCISGTITEIIDGDTVRVDDTTVRFALASAAELDEPGGIDARDTISAACPIGTPALVDEDDGQQAGSFGRTVGLVYCNGLLLNEFLLDVVPSSELFLEFCSTSEFSEMDWAVRNGC